MVLVTYCHKTVHCPKWNISVMLSGKYLIREGSRSEAVFSTASCPIVENSKLPPHKQKSDFYLLQCAEWNECELLESFKPVINLDVDGYVQ